MGRFCIISMRRDQCQTGHMEGVLLIKMAGTGKLHDRVTPGTRPLIRGYEPVKGDHKHIMGTECPYLLNNLESAFADFLIDIKAALEKQEVT